MERLEHIHLDLIGGIAGDMFVAALGDAFPECVPGLLQELEKLGEGRGEGEIEPRPSPGRRGRHGIALLPHSDGILSGRRFVVDSPDDGSHDHVAHREIQRGLRSARLEPRVLDIALELFELLAEAEASVHGIAADDVEFHELGAWDSIVDFVAAAYLIARLAPRRWTWSPPPIGAGRVKTAHGILPVPAPATAFLLQGMELVDDGVSGERVTPTGAAILKYLSLSGTPGDAVPAQKVLAATGHGFGTRRLPGVPNVVRCMAFAPSHALPATLDDEIATLQFEIDDQPAEDLAVALERIRGTPGVLEVFQLAAYGKKGRLATQVQVLARLKEANAIADACLSQTTTLGLRVSRVWRRTLMRAAVETKVPEAVRVKLAARPSGKLTAKAEMDDLARIPGGRLEREQARERAERDALDQTEPHDGRDRSDD